VDFRVLRNRDLAASIFLFVSLGFGLYGGTFIFPLFTQTILHFSPTETGLVMMPGGLATAATALICGRLLNGARPLVDARVLIGIGIGLFLYAMWDLGHLSTLAGQPDVRLALIVRGAGLGFLFTPINNVAYANLRPSEAQQAAGLINLSRQLGGSFGIAVLATYVTVHTQSHRVDLVADVYAGNQQTEQRVAMLQAALEVRGQSAPDARRTALAVLDQEVMRQAAMLSYNDAWILLLLTFVFVSPAVLLLRRPSPTGRGPPPAH
jgi:DHA2 family multidrug resistance protein